MKKFYFLAASLLAVSASFARYTSPQNGSKINLDYLVSNSSGAVTKAAEGHYVVSDTIFILGGDTLEITANAEVRFKTLTYLEVDGGTLVINPPDKVTFTEADAGIGFNGVRITNSTTKSIVRKLDFRNAVSFRLTDVPSMLFDNCYFYNNNIGTSTTFGNGTIALFRSHPEITNTTFYKNRRAAVQGGANIANAPKIINCTFDGNNTLNQNVPQINLGATGATDTVKIINSIIKGDPANPQAGGLGWLPLAVANILIENCTIEDNRYGISLQAGNAINALVKNNIIRNNNIQGNPNLGGSGIAFAGGTEGAHQNSIVTGNTITGNLWGITIQNRAKPNLGNIENASLDDDGNNKIYGNTNSGVALAELYNNSPDSIYAQNNYWGVATEAEIEARITHKPDNATLGLVIYTNYLTLPVSLLNFSASYNANKASLIWEVSNERNVRSYTLERSVDGQVFTKVIDVKATNATKYDFSEYLSADVDAYFYRLKIEDLNGSVTYSTIIKILLSKVNSGDIKIYPTIVTSTVNVNINSDKATKATITITDLGGRVLRSNILSIYQGTNQLQWNLDNITTKGVFLVKISMDNESRVFKIIKE